MANIQPEESPIIGSPGFLERQTNFPTKMQKLAIILQQENYKIFKVFRQFLSNVGLHGLRPLVLDHLPAGQPQQGNLLGGKVIFDQQTKCKVIQFYRNNVSNIVQIDYQNCHYLLSALEAEETVMHYLLESH